MIPQTFETWFAATCPTIPLPGAQAVLRLAEEGGTVPFIARYRKEQTGNLDEVAIQKALDSKERWDAIISRQAFIVDEIDRQKQLTPELRARIMGTFDLPALEDLYLPYKRKRKSRAAVAKEAGIGPLADWIWNCGHGTETPQEGQTLELWAFTFRNEEAGFPDVPKVLDGATDILIERLAEVGDLRQLVRDAYFKRGFVRSRKGSKAKAHSKYETYFEYAESVAELLKPEHSHRYLAARRGWMEEELILNIGARPSDETFEAELLQAFEAVACTVADSPGAALLLKAARIALKVHVMSSMENEAHKALKEVADDVAIGVFAENVRQLLLASPFGPKAVLGIDPGIRTGCKVAVVDDGGQHVGNTVIRFATDAEREHARKTLAETLGTIAVRAIAVGSGTAGRETEAFVRQTVKELGLEVPVVLVNEAGASVYSASAVARQEFPALDVTVRGAISIARRLQDPLAELVKIDPKSIGVGQYQHDVSQSALKRSLDHVVDSCVNQVGVNLNTASVHLLAHVSGLGPALAQAIVDCRVQKGLFRSRQQLLDIPRFSKKTFEQAAGFLRIPQGEHPLDNTGVHPERYPALEELASRLGKQVSDLLGAGVELVRGAGELRDSVGEFTFTDIVQELEKPGRDPRDEFIPFAYREDVHEIKDLQAGMVCPGIVTNVTNFGAFVDIGVHQDGLAHISQLSGRFVKDPHEIVKPGDRVEARILGVDLEKNQISLSLKPAQRPARPQRPARAASDRTPKTAKPTRSRPAQGQAAASKATSGDGRARGQHGGGGKARKDRPSRPSVPQRPAKPAFNNPFAVLAGLKPPKR